ncbi:MAG: pirin family protein [Gammaproteobacteria bacterium]|nr:pirin family protein [Gammaproteobacteria bacterium]MBT8109457.1 pirin family protein [Gammaproteobacteria bacterium]NND46405.1 pirin family protein [Woeseiaceae bacterium]NNL44159.1 pirin family protein [Woeseiaceae bacterium]
MLDVIQSETRGSADHGWLRAKHTFSFAEYQNPERVEFGKVRVINEDRIAPGKGFGTHPHKNMEIVTYVIDGAIAHKDSMGNGTVISAGEIQRMTAGTGVQHSEFNHSNDKELHLLQIWIYPEKNGLEPGYEQTRFSRDDKLNRLRLVGSRDGRDGSITIHQDVNLYASVLEPGHAVSLDLQPDRKVFVQVVDGDIAVNGQRLSAGDGAQMQDEQSLQIAAVSEAEFLVFDMT